MPNRKNKFVRFILLLVLKVDNFCLMSTKGKGRIIYGKRTELKLMTFNSIEFMNNSSLYIL